MGASGCRRAGLFRLRPKPPHVIAKPTSRAYLGLSGFDPLREKHYRPVIFNAASKTLSVQHELGGSLIDGLQIG